MSPTELKPYRIINKNRIFVFDKLNMLMNSRHDALDDGERLFAPPMPAMLKMATVDPLEAVREWGVMPVDYEVMDDPLKGLVIRHRAIDAQIARNFTTIEEVEEALADLLVGKPIIPKTGSTGHFEYMGQPMIPDLTPRTTAARKTYH